MYRSGVVMFTSDLLVRMQSAEQRKLALAPLRSATALMSHFFFSSRRRHTRCYRDWSSDVCSSDLFPVDGEDLGTAVAHRACEHVVEQIELAVTPHERCGQRPELAPTVARSEGPVSSDQLPEATELQGAGRLGLDVARGQPKGRFAHQDLPRPGGLLQPRRDVDGLTRCKRRVGLVDDDFARLHSDSCLKPELVNVVEDCQRRPHGPLGFVLVPLRDPDGGHDRVAGELLHRAAIELDAVRNPVEEGRDPSPDDLRIGLRDELVGIDEIDAQNGGKLALHPPNWRYAETDDRRRGGPPSRAALQACPPSTRYRSPREGWSPAPAAGSRPARRRLPQPLTRSASRRTGCRCSRSRSRARSSHR